MHILTTLNVHSKDQMYFFLFGAPCPELWTPLCAYVYIHKASNVSKLYTLP